MRNGIYHISANAFCMGEVSSQYHGHSPSAVGDTRHTLYYAEQMYLNAHWLTSMICVHFGRIYREHVLPHAMDFGYGMQPYVREQMNVHSGLTLTQNHFFTRFIAFATQCFWANYRGIWYAVLTQRQVLKVDKTHRNRGNNHFFFGRAFIAICEACDDSLFGWFGWFACWPLTLYGRPTSLAVCLTHSLPGL